MALTAAQVAADYAATASWGTVSIRRYAGVAPSRTATDYEARARVVNYDASELIGEVRQGDRRAIVLAADLDITISRNDTLILRGQELAIMKVDDSSRRVGDTLIAYELQVRGP